MLRRIMSRKTYTYSPSGAQALEETISGVSALTQVSHWRRSADLAAAGTIAVSKQVNNPRSESPKLIAAGVYFGGAFNS